MSNIIFLIAMKSQHTRNINVFIFFVLYGVTQMNRARDVFWGVKGFAVRTEQGMTLLACKIHFDLECKTSCSFRFVWCLLMEDDCWKMAHWC
jgi:hypothetical protein